MQHAQCASIKRKGCGYSPEDDEFSSIITTKDWSHGFHGTKFHCCILVHLVFEHVLVTRLSLTPSSAATLKEKKGSTCRQSLIRYGQKLTAMMMANTNTTRTTASPPAHMDMKIGKPKGRVNFGSEGLCVGDDDDGGKVPEDMDA